MTDELTEAMSRVQAELYATRGELVAARYDLAAVDARVSELELAAIAVVTQHDTLVAGLGSALEAAVARIATLEATCALLRAVKTVRPLPEGDATPPPARLNRLAAAQAAAAPRPAPPPCPHCGRREFTPGMGRTAHVRMCPMNPERKPRARREPKPKPSARAASRLASELAYEETYVCPKCGRAAFSKSPVRDMCIKCAAELSKATA